MARTRTQRFLEYDDFGPPIAGVVGKGLIRVGDDGDELRVTLLVSGERLVVRSMTTEVGAWDLEDVSIKRARKEFEISVGDEVVSFVPDDPDRFAAHSLVGKRSMFGRTGRGREKASRRQRSKAGTTDQAGRHSSYLPGDPYLPDEFADLQRPPADTEAFGESASEGSPAVPVSVDPEPPELPAWAAVVVNADAKATGGHAGAAPVDEAEQAQDPAQGPRQAPDAHVAAPIEPGAAGPAAEPQRPAWSEMPPPTDGPSMTPAPGIRAEPALAPLPADRPSAGVDGQGGDVEDRPAVGPTVPGRVLKGPWDPPKSVVTLVSVSDRATAELSKRTATGRSWAGWQIRLGCYYLMEQMSRIDAFPFNRIPEVTPEMRLKPGHVHDYRALKATSGLTRHVCTSCGSVVVRSGGDFGGPRRH